MDDIYVRSDDRDTGDGFDPLPEGTPHWQVWADQSGVLLLHVAGILFLLAGISLT